MGPVELIFHNLILVEYDDVISSRSGNVRRMLYDNMLSANLIITFRERSLFGGIVSTLTWWFQQYIPTDYLLTLQTLNKTTTTVVTKIKKMKYIDSVLTVLQKAGDTHLLRVGRAAVRATTVSANFKFWSENCDLCAICRKQTSVSDPPPEWLCLSIKVRPKSL